jgi:AraC-like DNA-binding protein
MSTPSENLLARLARIEQLLQAANDKPPTTRDASEYLGMSLSYLHRLTSQSRSRHFRSSGGKLLSHSNTRTTRRYVQVIDEKKREAADLLPEL